jgi:pimeloyl-ACP methyl ester carboxylesterase
MPIANLAGININYRVYGEGEPLVLIMGFGAPLSMGMDQVRFFKKHFRVVAFDNRGVGRSDKPRGHIPQGLWLRIRRSLWII